MNENSKSDHLRTVEEVLSDIKILVKNPGYIYPLLLIIFEDFHVAPEDLHKVDSYSQLNMNEAALLLGYLVQNPLDFTTPKSFDFIFEMKRKTYDLLAELHQSFHKPFYEKMENMMNGQGEFLGEQEFFGTGEMLIEPIFYSGTGVYDFQFLEFIERKYQYDRQWLEKNRGFIFHEVIKIVKNINEILHKKSVKVNLYVKNHAEKIKEKARKSYVGNNFEGDFSSRVK